MEETIYQRIKKRRLELDMSQEELAKKVGYSHKTAICMIDANEWHVSTIDMKSCPIWNRQWFGRL